MVFIKNVYNTSVFGTVLYLFNNKNGGGLHTQLTVFIENTVALAKKRYVGNWAKRNEIGERKAFFEEQEENQKETKSIKSELEFLWEMA